MFKLNMRSLRYTESSPTISLAELLTPNHIAEIVIKKSTPTLNWLKTKHTNPPIISGCANKRNRFSLSFTLILKYLEINQYS